jgi:SWI/SNF-related matrix-associated actin-dependent regulator 1 of chromatin subfamily A
MENENTFMKAYRLTGESKTAGITDFMETLIENNCKFIVFAHHQTVMDSLESFVKTKKIGYVRIDGKVGIDVRH